ncbi:MAG: hypothetical protein KAH84_06350, partial [Thiomargarita sp.]|nr:hypothetical protein [Thiomargarita sp.]
MSSILTQTLFAGLLDSPAVVEATAHVLERAIPVIKEHFTLTAAEISKAYQNSCRYSFVAIQIGLESPDSLIKKVRYPNITREFARQVENDYFQPFSEQHDALRNTLVKSLKKWAKTTDKLFVIKEITEEDLAAFIVQRETAAIGDLILAQMADIEAVDDGLSAFLRFKSLLGDSVLFFFREQLRTDSRVQATQMALQQERLCIEVKNVQATLDDLKETQARHPFLTEQISLQIENLAQWQTQHKQLLGFQNRFAGQLDKVLDWAQDLTVNVAFLQEDVAEIKQDGKRNLSLTEQILANLEALMAQQGLSAQMKVRDEFTQHNEQSLQLIKEAWQQFKGLSAQSPDYYRLANNFGSVLSSTGDVKKAIGLFQQVVERSSQPEEQALAYFNLFQLQLREKQYKVAVNNLQAAIKIDRHRYALHDVHKYPIKRLLGAG